MKYSHEVETMCPVAQGVNHGCAPIPQEGKWTKEVHVRSFITHNYTPYDGNEEFLTPATEATKELWDQVVELSKKEREAGGVLDMDTKVISTITSHAPGPPGVFI